MAQRKTARARRRDTARNEPRLTPQAGQFSPLSPAQIETIHAGALDILSQIGLSQAPENVQTLALDHGAALTKDGRLTFPRVMVDAMLADLPRTFTLHGRHTKHDLPFVAGRVHTATGGASPMVLDHTTGALRPSTLTDLYTAARLVEQLPHIHAFARPVIAGDMPDPKTLDINTAYASLAGTSKHVITSASSVETVQQVAQLCAMIAGSQETFASQPFLSLNINHVVPPLRFDADAVQVLVAAAQAGLPVMVNTFGQMGASSPVTMAGCLAQSHAETLAGMIIAWCANPQALTIYGARPMITDLRSGGMAGGSGEQALLTAAATQIARHLGLPNSTIAGATDSKRPDAQAGAEKAHAVALATQAGATLITQAAGTLAGLMATSLEAYVIDNDMLGTVLRAAMPIEVTDQTLSLEAIAQTVAGDGHFLGHPDTFARMSSDFLYPSVFNRDAPDTWHAKGAPDLNATAKERVETLLAQTVSAPIDPDTDTAIRARFDIRLPPQRTETK